MKKVKPKLIIDTDPGHDDALALLLLCMSKKFDVLAVTTVAGNATIDKVTRNAQAILDLVGVKVPVYSGQATPLARTLITAVVHGESGLAGFDTSTTKFALTEDADKQIVQLVNANPGQVTLLTLGPLTNIARAFQLDPSLPNKIKQLVMMGGAIDVPGNKNRVAEFNFFVDPEAADVVFKTDVPKILVSLDASQQVVLTVDEFRAIKNKKLQTILLPMMRHFFAGLTKDEGTQGILVYDALAAYVLLNPDAFTLQPMDVVIETRGEHTSGMSVAERRPNKVESTNVDVVVSINADLFKKDFFAILSRSSRQSTKSDLY